MYIVINVNKNKKRIISILLAASMLCSCGVSEPQKESRVTIASAETTAQAQTSGEQTTSLSQPAQSTTTQTTTVSSESQSQTTKASGVTSKAEKKSEKATQSDSSGRCSDFVFYTQDDGIDGVVHSDIAADPTAPVDVRLSCTVKIDYLASGLRDKEAERKAQLEKERLERERLEKERQEKEKLEKQRSEIDMLERDTDHEKAVSGSIAADIGEGSVKGSVNAGTDEKEYPAEYTAKSTADLRGFLSFYFEQSVVSTYLSKYNDSFFSTKDLLVKVIVKNAGDKYIPEYMTAAGNATNKTITIDLHNKELSTPIKARSSVLLQTAVAKTDFAKYGTNAVKWRIDVLPYYPLALATLNRVGWNLRAAFTASHSIPYYGHTADMPQDDKHSTNWYATYGFTNHKGNCYVMAGMFCQMAQLLGFKCVQISGLVRQYRGGYGAHSWCEVTLNGSVYMFDPNFTNETGLSGYMRKYGEKGTWQCYRVSEVKTM